jgi:hypothetical protein
VASVVWCAPCNMYFRSNVPVGDVGGEVGGEVGAPIGFAPAG